MIRDARVFIVERFQHDDYAIFVYPPSRQEMAPDRIWRFRHGRWAEEAVGENEPFTGLPEPSMTIPTFILDRLVDFYRKGHPSHDRDDAVTDARETRDRLLVLVEQLWAER